MLLICQVFEPKSAQVLSRISILRNHVILPVLFFVDHRVNAIWLKGAYNAIGKAFIDDLLN